MIAAMRLTLLSDREIVTTTLPKECAGHYWLCGKDDAGKDIHIVAVDTQQNEDGSSCWILKSNRQFKVTGQDSVPVRSIPMESESRYLIYDTKGRLRYVLFTNRNLPAYRRYTPYQRLRPKMRLVIGRDSNCDIIYKSRFVSSRHAELVFDGDVVLVRDLGSTNYTFVNGQAVRERRLRNGDTVQVMDLNIIVTSTFLFLNQPAGELSVPTLALWKYQPEQLDIPPMPEEDDLGEEEEELEEERYFRAPRFKYGVDTYELKLDAPPNNQNTDDTPMAMLVGPSMTMGMASVATGTFAITSAVSRGDITSAIPSVVMCFSMLMGTLLWPTLTKSYQRRKARRKEEKRQKAYSAYLEENRRKVAEEIRRQESILQANDADPSACISRILANPPQIWERTHKHSDFLSLRLGIGDLPMNIEVQYAERRFDLDEDNLLEAMYRFGEEKRVLHDVPVCLPLVERYISGIYGEKRELYRFARSLILQIAALHAYDEVRLVVLYPHTAEEQFGFTRWLPHTIDRESNTRWIATNFDEAKELSSILDPLIEYRKSLSDDKCAEESPYYVVVCLDKELTVRTECVRRILEHKSNLRFSVLCMFERLQDLPKECSAVVELGGSLTLINDVSEPACLFKMDPTDRLEIERAAAVLSNTEIDVGESSFTLPKQYTFLEMLDIGMVEHLNLADRWKSSDPTRSLAAKVGIDRYGEPFVLDLHEKAHGPHGLVAGMTGSGKSEFLLAYLLSMAISFHPNDVAFILIDYKGGGMAKALEELPHTAGVITNLDGNGIKRSLASMRSELHRREAIFAETSKRYGIGNIDIYKYQRLYREGKVSQPLPHLLIVSDEFAELKKDQPDFMDELTSTARVGRSLGVHLILATQKPGGVVDDQIRSNSRFRVCLKVQDAGDSLEMLARPEASRLVETGRFYLQVGNNELFELGQSAWAGAPYYPSQRTIVNKDDSVAVINTNGRILAEANIDRYAAFKNPPKQLDVLASFIRDTGRDMGFVPWKMWLDPIPAKIYSDDLAKRAGEEEQPFVLNPIVGLYDDPSNQKQDLLRLPISEGGNTAIYGSAGNGKAQFVETMCCELMRCHSPREVNLYLLDFDTELLTAFAAAPHVGEVILSYETEKVQNLFKLLMGEVETRKKLLANFGGDLLHYNLQASAPRPNLVVVISNYAVFSEMYEPLTADLNYLSREGKKYGLYFVLTCTGINNIKLNLRQNFKNLYCLQLNNPDDYTTVIGKTGGLTPEKFKGRGIYRRDKDSVLEFQTALPCREDPPYPVYRRLSEELALRWGDVRARRVPTLPESVDEAFLAPYCVGGSLDKLPVGVEKETLEIARFSLSEQPVSLVLASEREWVPFVDALSRMVPRRCGVRTMLLAPEGWEKDGSEPPELEVYSDLNGCVDAVHTIFQTVLTRNNSYKDALDKGEQPPTFEPLLVVVRSMAQLKAALARAKVAEERKTAADDTPLNRLFLAMEKCDSAYRVSFLVAEEINALAPFTAEGWYRRHINGNRGLWLGGGISSQFRLTVNKKPREDPAGSEADFGYVVRSAAARLVKFLH